MVTYIYFVKCPDCEDEYFDFFDEAKEFALGCLSKKPIITQTEVCRNDFGECTDHSDLGTIWSWEDECRDTEGDCTEAESASSIFTKDDLKRMADGSDPEFDSIDNSVDFEVEEPVTSEISAIDDVPDNFRKPIPEGMTIEELVEEMEENEDTVECTWCEDLFDKSECRYEVNLGWLCSRCEAAIKSRGETLTFKENSYWDFLDESAAIKDSTVIGKHVRLVENGADMNLATLKHILKINREYALPRKKIDFIVTFDNDCIIRQETDLGYLITIPCYYRNPVDRSKILEQPEYHLCWISKKYCEIIGLEEELEPEELHDLGNEYDGGYPADETDVLTEAAADYEYPHLAKLEDAKSQVLDALKQDLPAHYFSGDSLNVEAVYSKYGFTAKVTDFIFAGNRIEIKCVNSRDGHTYFEDLKEVFDGLNRGCSANRLFQAIRTAAKNLDKKSNPGIRAIRDANVFDMLTPEVAEEFRTHIKKIEYRIPLLDLYEGEFSEDKNHEPLTDEALKKLEDIYNNFLKLDFAQEAIDIGIVRNRSASEDTNHNIENSWAAVGNITFDCQINKLSLTAQNIILTAKVKKTDDSSTASDTAYTTSCYRLANALIKYFDNNVLFFQETREPLAASLEGEKKSMLEELEDKESYNSRLVVCPECGFETLDLETGICINCGFNHFD
jgi:hypothetical protein